MGEGAGGRGVFGLSAGARFALPSLAYPVGGTEEDPSSAAARATAPFPHRGEGFWGGWKPPRRSAAPLTEKEAA